MINNTTSQSLDVRTLVCHQHVNFATRCLASLVRFLLMPLLLTIHDDGTLTNEDKNRLRAAVPGARVVSRSEADQRVLPALAKHPNCAKWRAMNPLSLKILDVPLMAGDSYAFSDSDILYIRPFVGLKPQQDLDMVYMLDRRSAYSMSYRDHFVGRSRIRLPDRVNAGLMHVRTACVDLDFIEWFLQHREYWRHPWLMEQTCWAAMAPRVRAAAWDDRQVTLPAHLSQDAVALHFITPLRHRLSEFGDTQDMTEQPPAVLRTAPPTYSTAAGVAFDGIVRRARTLIGLEKDYA